MNLISIIILSATQLFNFWGANGHRVVAQICEWHLSESAKEEVTNILGAELMAEVTNWPDYVKSEREWKFADSWHYTTVHPDQTVEDMERIYARDSSINDATEAISLMIDVLKGDAAATAYFDNIIDKNRARRLNNSTKATAMAYLVHLVGDIHQPMHVGKNRDQGGNKIEVLFFNDRYNIHSVWDTRIIEHERLSYTEFATFINKTTSEMVADLQDDPMEEWARESIEIREHIYNTLYDYTDRASGLPSLSWKYQHDNIVVVEKRLLEAGIRLAGILNEIYRD